MIDSVEKQNFEVVIYVTINLTNVVYLKSGNFTLTTVSLFLIGTDNNLDAGIGLSIW